LTHVAPRRLLSQLGSNLTSPEWWKAAAIRGGRTAIMIALPYLGAAALISGVPWLSIVSAAALGFVASLLTSLAGLTEAVGEKVPLWLALLERVTKTVAQALAAGIGSAVLFENVDWAVIGQAALIAGLGSLLLGVLTRLPEAAIVPVAAPPTAAVVQNVFLPDGADSKTIAETIVEAQNGPRPPSANV
jgi:hypothetical protein